MHITQITDPLVEPVTLTEAKTLLRIEAADEDALLASLIATARITIENSTGRALLTRELEAVLDRWPNGRRITLPMPPLQTVQSVTLPSPDGDQTVWDQNLYQVEATGPAPYLALKPGVAWPSAPHANASIRIRYVAGYGNAATDVPPPLAHAVLLLVAHWYENRVPVVINGAASRIPGTVDALIANYRLRRL